MGYFFLGPDLIPIANGNLAASFNRERSFDMPVARFDGSHVVATVNSDHSGIWWWPTILISCVRVDGSGTGGPVC